MCANWIVGLKGVRLKIFHYSCLSKNLHAQCQSTWAFGQTLFKRSNEAHVAYVTQSSVTKMIGKWHFQAHDNHYANATSEIL